MLNLLYLKYFIDAVRQGSVSGSARANFVSQSAVSQGIGKLEASLGIDLIHHHPNRFKVTPEGQTVFHEGMKILDNLKLLQDSLKEGEFEGNIEFACMHSFALALLPPILKKARKALPKLSVHFRLGHAGLIIDMLKKGVIDFGIVLDNEDLSAFDQVEIYQGQYRTYVSKKVKDSSKMTFLLPEQRMETNRLKTAHEKRWGKELPVGMEVFSWEVIASLTEEGLGIGFFPDYVALKKKSLREHELDLPPLDYKIYAISLKGRPLSKNVQAFLNLWS